MSKILCLFSLALAVILMIIFILDISAGIPFHRDSIVLDSVFIVAGAVLAVLSFLTYREQ